MKADKRDAWDLIGGLFWRCGRETAKPSAQEVETFLASPPGHRVCVIGASTRDLVTSALDRGFDVTVIDFSEVMGRDLANDIRSGCFQFINANILTEVDRIEGRYDLIVADRLVNRFVHHDLSAFIDNCRDILVSGGELRTSVKLGLYPMDEQLFAAGRRDGTIDLFFDAACCTVDYSAAKATLETIAVEHGSIPREVLLQWYVGRGKECRFQAQDIDAAFERARGWGMVRSIPFSEVSNTKLWVARRQKGDGDC